jgi:oxaloacetate decarboxylase (Na+ extruding) subunit alpha
MNVSNKERYAVVPDEVIRYALGKFGRPNIPIAPEVMDRIDSLPRTRELRDEPGMPPLPELRRRIGPELSDEAFLLRATMPAVQVDAMKPVGETARTYDPELVPVKNLIRQLTSRHDLTYIAIEKPNFKLELSSSAPGEAGA